MRLTAGQCSRLVDPSLEMLLIDDPIFLDDTDTMLCSPLPFRIRIDSLTTRGLMPALDLRTASAELLPLEIKQTATAASEQTPTANIPGLQEAIDARARLVNPVAKALTKFLELKRQREPSKAVGTFDKDAHRERLGLQLRQTIERGLRAQKRFKRKRATRKEKSCGEDLPAEEETRDMLDDGMAVVGDEEDFEEMLEDACLQSEEEMLASPWWGADKDTAFEGELLSDAMEIALSKQHFEGGDKRVNELVTQLEVSSEQDDFEELQAVHGGGAEGPGSDILI